MSGFLARGGLGLGAAMVCYGLGALDAEIPAPIVKAPKAQVTPKRRHTSSAAGFGSALPITILVEGAELQRAAQQAVEFALTPELQTWVSTVLTNAGRRGLSLERDFDIADVLLHSVQNTEPLAKRTVLLAAAFAAAALPVYLVAHGAFQLTDTLTAVFLDGAWYYADPNSAFALGEHKPFTRERFFEIPGLPKPATVLNELRELRAQLVAQQQQIAEQQAQLDALIHSSSAELQAVDALIRSSSAELQAAANTNKILLILVVSAAALALFWYSRSNQRPEQG